MVCSSCHSPIPGEEDSQQPKSTVYCSNSCYESQQKVSLDSRFKFINQIAWHNIELAELRARIAYLETTLAK